MSSSITYAQDKITSKLYAKVVINLPLESLPQDYFYYLIPDELKDEIKTSTVVRIPFGNQETIGFVVGLTSKDNLPLELSENVRLKPIYEVIYKRSIWDEKFLNLAEWISKYYLTNIGTILKASINTDIFDHFSTNAELINDYANKNIIVSKDEQFIIDKLLNSKKQNLSYRYLFQKAKFTKQKFYYLINNLKKKGVIITKKERLRVKHKNHKQTLSGGLNTINTLSSKNSHKQIVLNNYQEKAFNTILDSIEKNENKTFLLHGVTGSGKTEVYLRLIKETIKRNKTVIYLVPEIYLIPQIYERLISRFNNNEIIIWHSLLSSKERFINWERLENSNIILGARSAILSPTKNVGLIVIDEAHESSYKQASPAPRYDATLVAKKRSEIENCPLILGTATPNISEFHNSFINNAILELPKRVKDLPLPKVNIVDLKEESITSSRKIISNILKSSINQALNKKEQVILLLNRRGYSSHIFCRACGYIQFCKNCSVPLVYHKTPELIVCHHCGFQKGLLDIKGQIKLLCPECSSPHFKYFGLGTQQLEEEIKLIFPHAKTIRVDSDQLRNKDKYFHLWQEFASGVADILIGTQIVAKGLDLPNVTVVGIILADTMLNFPDYVSYEKAFQTITQMTGRTGRGEKPGNVIIQTYQAENPLFNFIKNHDYLGFYKSEIVQREKFLYPPFTRLTRLIFQSQEEKDCIEHANKALELLKETSIQYSALSTQDSTLKAQSTIRNPQFLGPAPCFFTKLHGKYRYHIICKIKDDKIKEQIFNNLFEILNKNAKVEVIVDVDAINLL